MASCGFDLEGEYSDGSLDLPVYLTDDPDYRPPSDVPHLRKRRMIDGVGECAPLVGEKCNLSDCDVACSTYQVETSGIQTANNLPPDIDDEVSYKLRGQWLKMPAVEKEIWKRKPESFNSMQTELKVAGILPKQNTQPASTRTVSGVKRLRDEQILDTSYDLQKLVSVLTNLDDDQRNELTSLGLGGLLKLRVNNMHTELASFG